MLACLLTAVLALAAQDAAPDAAALMSEYDQLMAEFGKATDEFWASIAVDADGTLHPTEEQMASQPDILFGPRFVDLAKRAGKAPAGAKALSMALRTQQSPDEVREVTGLLMANFLDSPEMKGVVQRLGGLRWSLGSTETEALLRRVVESTPVEEVKLSATFELAMVLMDPVYSHDPGGNLQGAPRGDVSEARALFESLVRDHPESSPAKRAKGFLFELDHLQVGMVAPDVEAVDQDGVAFKLSDYRGKVVLVDFWGFW